MIIIVAVCILIIVEIVCCITMPEVPTLLNPEVVSANAGTTQVIALPEGLQVHL